MARGDLRLLLGLAALTVALVAVQAFTGAEVLLASPASSRAERGPPVALAAR